ncbi:hypothetical protein C7377_0167 [Balneicella halophila]|uniref:Outer membrane protein transport protein (OMPP1/FadL/TodX) n=1 Tax=Balneicella halophila TaxID=1537566 RepID=A0A7L4UQ35_BALHA|nr:hypothetical protein [Balneicella halophila]PVX51876.1 hypothetical protein C7377_0167 [Balneicella halophila]
MKKILIIAFSLCIVQLVGAQTYEDAIRYSNFNFFGTARSSAMGGAFGSLGGDLSVTSNNPAGLAIYRNSSASITPGMHFSEYDGNGLSGDDNTFILPQVGFVFTTIDDSSDIKNWNFGVTYTQGANYNSEYKLANLGSPNSRLDDISHAAEGFTPDEVYKGYAGLLPALAYESNLIYENPDVPNTYMSDLYDTDIMNISHFIEDEGSAGEVAFSAAGNFDDILYFGATVGLQSIEFKSIDNYSEHIADVNSESILDQFYYDKDLRTRGTGINFKAGLIFRPIIPLKLSLAIHTPTYFSMEEEYLYRMESVFIEEPYEGEGKEFVALEPIDGTIGIYEYNFQTPWKFSFGGSYIFGQNGLISIDYDLIDYSSSKFTDGDFNIVNEEIKNTFKMTGNLKVGAEVRLSNQFSLRGGYNYFGNMYEDNSGMEQEASQYSAGVGYRYKNVFMDASYQYYSQENTFTEYNSSYDYNISTVKFTIGYQF